MAAEKIIEKHLKATIEGILGGWCIKLLPFVIAGLPDRLCLLPGGRMFFVETKATGKTVKPRQAVVHAKLRKLGFQVFVIDSIEGIRNDILERYAE